MIVKELMIRALFESSAVTERVSARDDAGYSAAFQLPS